MQARKVRLADIERLRRSMQTLPEHRAEEVTTAEAVRMLSPEIRAMQAKGYGLSAIAAHLSDNGLALTTKTLKAYMGEARAGAARKKRRKAKAHRAATGAAATSPTTESKLAVVCHAAAADAQRAARVDTMASPMATMPPTAPATPGPPKGTAGMARSAGDTGIRRSAFVPEEDWDL